MFLFVYKLQEIRLDTIYRRHRFRSDHNTHQHSELLESFTDYTHIFTDGSKDGDKTAAAFICQSFEFSKR